MLENAVKGAMAGLAGTTALNAATYADMVWRGVLLAARRSR
jgi:hypothetical protein